MLALARNRMEYIIETTNLSKKFSNKVAVDKVNMHIKKGDIYGFIGKNGAGKTTAMKMILGLLNPSEGEITLFGSNDLNKGREKIGSLIESPGLYKNCTAYENLKRFSILYGGTDEEIKDILVLIGLSDTGNKKAGRFSLGMKQRLGIGIALLGNPELLVLDEPINGLDPAGIKEIRDLLMKLNKERGVTILISSHILDELAKITTTYGIINEGRLIEEVSASELEENCKKNLTITVSDVDKSVELLKSNDLLGEYEIKDSSLVLYSHFENAGLINTTLVTNGITVSELTNKEVSLEDYFIERLGK